MPWASPIAAVVIAANLSLRIFGGTPRPTPTSTSDRSPTQLVSARVFLRSTSAAPPVAASASGSTITDADGRTYLDAAGGAIVVNVGHGRESVARVMAEQAGRVAYAHGSVFTTEPLERWVAAVGPHLPMDDAAIYPVSGGSEATETALKMARAYHVARGETERWIVIGRWGSYHGNTLGALDLSGRRPLRRPYEAWLGRFRHVSAAYPYRAGDPGAMAAGHGRRMPRPSWSGCSWPPGPAPSPRSWPSPSWAPPSPPPSPPMATGTPSAPCCDATACCSSLTR